MTSDEACVREDGFDEVVGRLLEIILLIAALELINDEDARAIFDMTAEDECPMDETLDEMMDPVEDTWETCNEGDDGMMGAFEEVLLKVLCGVEEMNGTRLLILEIVDADGLGAWRDETEGTDDGDETDTE